ncbi:phage tail protein [Actinoplanes aureus]|uniref:Uncharacterized protein n=1 Tax=Actinoplanes aureus TaxID=2792083 RepID=A0A931CA85_9ACTN|nr:hypothetical protein [Actinoplanes aureus]MBG0562871.1 hypothetical protein [Actinoplanes aureus]
MTAKKRHIGASHPPAKAEAAAAGAAAKQPADHRVAEGKAAQAENMNEAKPREFDKGAFVQAVEKAIAERAPKNLEEADEFAGSGKAAEVKDQVQGQVEAGKATSAGEIAATTAAGPDTSGVVDKQVVPLEADRPPGVPARPDPRLAVPDKAPPAATDFSAGPRQIDRQMADAQVTEQQLAKSNEPRFTGALDQRKTAGEHSADAPGKIRADEHAVLAEGKAAAGKEGAEGMAALAADRRTAGQQVAAGKSKAQSADEQKQAAVTAVLQSVFDVTKKDVEAILTGLDQKVDAQFTEKEKTARDAFTAEHRREMDAYKERRYSGGLGWYRWGRDKLLGLPKEADDIFVRAREGYVRRMRQVISDIADLIGAELNRAKQRIARGRDELKAAIDKLPADQKAIAREAASEFSGRFDDLEQSVDDKGTELVDTLATKYTDALKAVDDEIAAEKEKNKGLVAKAVDAVKGVIKTILELKNLLLGVLAKAAQAVMLILKDPIGFLRNLVSAVGAGLRLFLANIGTHLLQGMLGWLLGAAARAGIQLPQKLDAKGLLLMLASMLGLTAAAIKARIMKKLPPPARQATGELERAAPILVRIGKEGPGAIWEDLKARVGDLKKQLFDNIADFIIPTVIQAGIMWVLSLLNPASAFIRACKLIIDIVRFIVERGRQIIEFVNAVLDAVIAIARGGAGGVAALIERALARSIPILIGVLAAILGLGGIPGRVRKFVEKLAKQVGRAVDWVIDKIVALLKKAWEKLKSLLARRASRPKPGKKETRSEKQKLQAIAAALRKVEGIVAGGGDRKKVEKAIPRIKRRYGLTELVLIDRAPGVFRARASINPTGESENLESPEKISVTKEDLYATPGKLSAKSWDVELMVNLPGGSALWGLASVPMRADGTPDPKGPTMGLYKNSVSHQGKTYSLAIKGITSIALDLVNARYRETFGRDPETLGGSLQEDNLKHFQKEWYKAQLAMPGAGSEAWAQVAIRKVSFGSHREAVGYANFTIELGGLESVDVEGFGKQLVPGSVSATARK